MYNKNNMLVIFWIDILSNIFLLNIAVVLPFNIEIGVKELTPLEKNNKL